MQGYVHSIESFGTVDGPGIRLVVFFQGCPLRCKYCHNPDTWAVNIGGKMSVQEILDKYDSCAAFLKNGGITVTGGEPLLQIDFLTQLFKECKVRDIHTCVDTSGITFTRESKVAFENLMQYVDLVLLDIKHIDSEEHKKLTGAFNTNILEFAKYLDSINKPVWIRHVLVPGITTDEKYLLKLGEFIADLKNVKALDILPYHTMGTVKYTQLGMEPPLKNVPEATKELALSARKTILKGIRQRRIENKDKK